MKEVFPFFTHHPETAYLDSNATSLVPERVYRAAASFEEQVRANAHRGLYREAEEATRLLEEARAQVAHFIGAEPDEVVFTPSATLSAHMLTTSLERGGIVRAGKKVVASVFDHHALFLPFADLAKRAGASFGVLPHKEHDLDLEKVAEVISPETVLVGMPLVSNVSGKRFDLPTSELFSSDVGAQAFRRRSAWEVVRERARELGALTVLDATAGVGHFPLNVKDLDADFLFFSGHKMLGPQGVGVLYGKREKWYTLPPSVLGGGMVADVLWGENGVQMEWQEGVVRFEAGSPYTSGAVGLAEATRFLEEEVGLAPLAKHAQGLVAFGEKLLQEVEGVRCVHAPAKGNAGALSFVLEGVHAHDLAQVCAEEGVAVRAGHHCALPLHRAWGVPATLRASVHCYTTEEDIERLVRAVGKAKKLFEI